MIGRNEPEGRMSPEPVDPVGMARRDLKKALPRRFYDAVTATARDGGFGIDLDGKPVRTPAKASLIVPASGLAELLAEEWRAQTEWIDPDLMPITRLVNTGIDGVAKNMDATVAEVAKYAETDLVCYRAGEPEALVEAQSEAWDPVLAAARDLLGARFVCAEGMMFVEQPEDALVAVRSAVDQIAAGPSGHLRLAALSVMTSLTGSVLIALMIVHRVMTVEAAWAAANVDEDWQLRQWGDDPDALARRELRWRDMRSAADVYVLAA